MTTSRYTSHFLLIASEFAHFSAVLPLLASLFFTKQIFAKSFAANLHRHLFGESKRAPHIINSTRKNKATLLYQNGPNHLILVQYLAIESAYVVESIEQCAEWMLDCKSHQRGRVG